MFHSPALQRRKRFYKERVSSRFLSQDGLWVFRLRTASDAETKRRDRVQTSGQTPRPATHDSLAERFL
ncbi:MAG: hypothetical protein JNM40_25105 [Myxococcales bacterium]|nr:hypothetical protein [Myxococcales bacterium]